MKVESREYKLLVNHEPFVDPGAALKALWEEIEEAAQTLPSIRTKGKLDEKETRTILFLDTPAHTLRRHGLVLRQRADGEAVEYTLKCRSEDRYFAAGTDVGAADGLNGKPKLEEDIAPPFRCRFSHSTTVTMAEDRKTALAKAPRTLRQAAALFPVLGTLTLDGRPCSPDTALAPVNNITIQESVWKGGKVVFESPEEADSGKGGVALILWARRKDSLPTIAELSFRIKEAREGFTRASAVAARSVYELLQRLDWFRTEGMTKTEYVYRDASRD
jgi:hypothetical protein